MTTLPRPGVPRYLSDPVGVVTDIVLGIEPDLDRDLVAETVRASVALRPGQRELAQALHDAPDLLTSARPEGPRAIERLIRALQDHGARNVVPPRCARCGKTRPLPSRDGSKRICNRCYSLGDNGGHPCSACGNTRVVAHRDHLGRPRCRPCGPEETADPVDALLEILCDLEPGLPREVLLEAVHEAIPRPAQLRQTLTALRGNPALLTGQGAHGSPRVITLIDALVERGAVNIIAPSCSRCGNVKPLHFLIDKIRCCRSCYQDSRLENCSGCGQRRPVSTRTAEGLSVCRSCLPKQPSELGTCGSCGRTGRIASRATGQPLCRACFLPTAVCSVCGTSKPCHFAATEHPRCPSCSRKLAPPQTCSRCGRRRPVRARTPDGQAICQQCGQVREPCHTCGKTRVVKSRTPAGEPFCGPCWGKSPLSFRECDQCGSRERLFHHGLCNSCARVEAVRNALGDDTGDIRSDLTDVTAALTTGDPLTTLHWLERPSSRGMLAALAAGTGPVSHQVLDSLQPPRAASSLRAVLVAHGALPARDEQLAALERWLATTLAGVTTPEERRLVQSFATWHHLRRLRRASKTSPITNAQAVQVRREVKAAIDLLAWLNGHGRTLMTCNQGDVDLWLDGSRSKRAFARNFLLWARRNRHSAPVEIPAVIPRTGTNFIDQDVRWELIRHLLHDEAIDIADRVAGLLVLLFAQPLTRVVRITPNEIVSNGEAVTLVLGREPLVLPPPLDELFLRLRDRPVQHPRTDDTDRKWLFAGGSPGTPLSTQQLMHRLHALGIRSRPARNTTLRDRAAELPAAILSKLLGVHISTAVRWSRTSGTPRAEYAAELARREAFRKS
ncbi:hypothetical protein [Streptomyces zhihengii]|uniref:hypothetical protein n=1 Tax=Streptomyces zhihengii TaxID=1818004 RepID=UPI0033BD8087